MAKKYKWIYRIRSDNVALQNVPLPSSLSTDYAHVPALSMSGEWFDLCANDDAFFCPRKLCRPYFTMLELWTSEYNVGNQTGEDDINESIPGGLAGPPAQPYQLPHKDGVWLGDQFWFFARYGGHTCDSKTHEMPDSCCGLLRPVEWYYVQSSDKLGPCRECEMPCEYSFRGRHDDRECQDNSHQIPYCQYLGCRDKCLESKKKCSEVRETWWESTECKNPSANTHCHAG